MITENLSTLKIHKLSQEQYDRELAAGNIDESAIYLTPDDNSDNVGIEIDTELNENSINPVTNKAITQELKVAAEVVEELSNSVKNKTDEITDDATSYPSTKAVYDYTVPKSDILNTFDLEETDESKIYNATAINYAINIFNENAEDKRDKLAEYTESPAEYNYYSAQAVNNMLETLVEEKVQYIAQDTAPDDTNVLWVDTSDDTSDFEQVSIDTSLSISGYAADAKAVGDALEEKQPKGNYLTEVPSEYVTEEELSAKGYLTGYTETDPTVPAWAKENTKPTYTANEVGADASGTASSLVEAHNVASDAHVDIREQIAQVSDEVDNLKKIYIGNTAPTDISDGTIWIDTSEE